MEKQWHPIQVLNSVMIGKQLTGWFETKFNILITKLFKCMCSNILPPRSLDNVARNKEQRE